MHGDGATNASPDVILAADLLGTDDADEVLVGGVVGCVFGGNWWGLVAAALFVLRLDGRVSLLFLFCPFLYLFGIMLVPLRLVFLPFLSVPALPLLSVRIWMFGLDYVRMLGLVRWIKLAVGGCWSFVLNVFWLLLSAKLLILSVCLLVFVRWLLFNVLNLFSLLHLSKNLL